MNRNKSNAFSLMLNKKINDQIDLIKKFPGIGKQTDEENIRVKVFFSYLLYYEIIEQSLFILTIRHAKQQSENIERSNSLQTEIICKYKQNIQLMKSK